MTNESIIKGNTRSLFLNRSITIFYRGENHYALIFLVVELSYISQGLKLRLNLVWNE
ncbi:MAG: hypothetical protein ACLTZB_04830 [Streptococcus salivarius]